MRINPSRRSAAKEIILKCPNLSQDQTVKKKHENKNNAHLYRSEFSDFSDLSGLVCILNFLITRLWWPLVIRQVVANGLRHSLAVPWPGLVVQPLGGVAARAFLKLQRLVFLGPCS